MLPAAAFESGAKPHREGVEELHVKGRAVGRAEEPREHVDLEPLDRVHVMSEQEQVERHRSDHIGPLDFERHLAAVAQPDAVHLRRRAEETARGGIMTE